MGLVLSIYAVLIVFHHKTQVNDRFWCISAAVGLCVQLCEVGEGVLFTSRLHLRFYKWCMGK